MPGTAAKIVITEKQQKLLVEFSKSRTISKCITQRTTIILLAFSGMFNEEIALQVSLNRIQVGMAPALARCLEGVVRVGMRRAPPSA